MNKDEIYLKMAQEVSELSHDSGTKVGAVIIGANGTPTSFGYNGTLAGIDENLIPQTREPSEVKLQLEVNDGESTSTTSMKVMASKYNFEYHAESNAIHFASKRHLVGATIYQTFVPCVQCAKEIVRAKIKRIVCPENGLTSGIGSHIGQDFDQVLAVLALGNVSIKIGNKEYFPKIVNEAKSEDLSQFG